MEQLLCVARREHSKAILQLQQLSKRVILDKARAAEVAEMGRARVEAELGEYKKRLQSVEVERNLMMVSLVLRGGVRGVTAVCGVID